MRRPLAALAVAATTLALLLAGCANDADRRAPLRRARLDEPRGETDGAQESGHDDATRAGQGRQAARGRVAQHPDHARVVHALGADRRRHRRLPLLPARPGPRRGRVVDRHARPARQPRRRPPRHPVPDRARPGGRGRGEGRDDLWAGLDLLRRHRASRASSTASTTPRGSAPGRPAARSRSPGTGTACPSTRAAASSCRCTTTCWRARSPTRPRPRSAGVPRSADLTALHTFLLPAPVELPCRPEHSDGPLCDREAAVQNAKARFGEGPGQLANVLHLLCGTDAGPIRDHGVHPPGQPPDDDPRRRRPHAPARALDQARRPTSAPPTSAPSSTSASGTSTTRGPSRSSRCTSRPATRSP